MTAEANDRREADRRAGTPPVKSYGVDARGTSERAEMRFLVSRETVQEADRVARASLTLGDAEADSPWYTTTYCDTADHRIYGLAERGHGSLLRFREYHSRRPERALASRRIWIEWKDEGGERSRKRRVIVRPDDIAPFLRGEEEAVAGAGAAISRDLLAGGPRPVVVTQCRRVAYASRRDDIRITFDHDLTYYAPEGPDPSDPTPCPLGTILAREANILVELKWQQVLPDWLAQLLADLRHRAEDRPPKFVVAMRHLLAHPGAEHASPRANAL